MKTLFFIFIAFILSSFLHATIINVPDDQPTIQLGIVFAANTDTVLVQPGTYVENINYNGKLITVGSLFLTTQDTTYISTTIIDGNSNGTTVVTFENSEDSTAVLCGFTITNGLASGSFPQDCGGGILCWNNSSPSLESVIISNNSASGGGGIYCWGANPILTKVTITGNSADYGGGIECYSSNPSLQNVTIAYNTSEVYGGGLYCRTNSDPGLVNCIMWNDSPSEIYISSGSVTATYSDIQGGFTGTGNIDDDPLFVDPGSGDYHLQIFSPCVNRGDPLSPLDPDGTRADMGAYYFPMFPPDADFTADITNGEYPLTVYFTDLSTQVSGEIDEWYWEFGDGNNSSLQNPVNEYQLPESYTISLTVTDVNDSIDTETKVDYIIVNALVYNGSVWHISKTGSDVWGNGSTQYPFATIQHGINASSNTDTVLVQPGTYGENINYNGKLITVASLFLTTQNISHISTTIINGNFIGNVVTFENGENSNAVLCGFTIINGYALYGGGILCCYGSSPSLENLTITGNSASDSGGGILCYDSCSPILENLTISDNTASILGGGIVCYASNPSLINSILWNDSPLEIYIYSSSIAAKYSNIQGGWTGTGNIDSDPLFSDPGNRDYHLTWSNFPIPDATMSPCIDAGDSASPLDPDGTIVEMGAYFFPQFIEAGFTANITNGDTLLTVNFTDLSTQGTGVIDEWYWDLGDGNNSSLQNPSNEYQSGCYTVSLTVTDVNDFTDTETKVDYITVNPPAYSGPVWHISTNGDDVLGNGSEQFPFATIQHGINISADTDTVLVQPGTFVENINYNGKLITVGSLYLTTQDTSYISTTVIDGNSSGSVITFENSESTTAILCGFTIINGSAYSGGGIYCLNYASPSLQNITISGNVAWFHGGGIECESNSSPILQNVKITGNSASYGGGIKCESHSSPILQNVKITGNSASTGGGGIWCYNYSSPGLQNVIISGNSASYGGGIGCSWYSSPSLENVTITGNITSFHGGGISCSLNSNPSLINSILWNDPPQEIYIESSSVTATYSDIQGGWAGTCNIDSDPLFVDAGSGDYHLQSISPCIDAGDPAFPLDPDGTIADMGAYYFHQTIAPDPPQNLMIEIIGTDVHLSWDAVTGANSYKVYSSNDPYTGFVEDTSGSFAGESWSAPIGDIQKFYYVIASTEIIRSKDSNPQDAYQPDRKSSRYESDKLINRKRY